MYTKNIPEPDGGAQSFRRGGYQIPASYAGNAFQTELSPDFGIVVSARTVAGGMPVYAFEALTVSTDPADWQSAAHYDVTR